MSNMHIPNIIIPSDEQSKTTIREALHQISDSLTRIEAERDHIKDILQVVEDKVDVPKKYIRKMARIYHKQNLQEVLSENEDLETLYEVVNP